MLQFNVFPILQMQPNRFFVVISSADLIRRTALHDLTFVEQRDLIAEHCRLLHIVRGEKDRAVPVPLFDDQLVDLLRRHGIESARGLIEKHYLRRYQQHSCQAEAYFHALGQLHCGLFGAPGKADLLERFVDSVMRNTVNIGKDLEVVGTRQPVVNTVVVHHDADPLFVGAGECIDVFAKHRDLARIFCQLPRDYLYQRRLARARRPQKPEYPAFPDVQIDPVQDLSGSKTLTYPFRVYHRKLLHALHQAARLKTNRAQSHIQCVLSQVAVCAH